MKRVFWCGLLLSGCIIIIDKDDCEDDGTCEEETDEPVESDEPVDTEVPVDTDLEFVPCDPDTTTMSADIVPRATVTIDLEAGTCAAVSDDSGGSGLIFEDFTTELGAFGRDLTIVAVNPGLVDDSLGDARASGWQAGDTVVVELVDEDGGQTVWVQATLSGTAGAVTLVDVGVAVE